MSGRIQLKVITYEGRKAPALIEEQVNAALNELYDQGAEVIGVPHFSPVREEAHLYVWFRTKTTTGTDT